MSRYRRNPIPAKLVEDWMIEIYRESFEPERPQGRRYSAAKVARLLKKRHNIQLCRKTAWSILHRRGVWEPDGGNNTLNFWR